MAGHPRTPTSTTDNALKRISMMTEIQKQVRYALIRDQLAAHIPYEQANEIARLNDSAHQKTLQEVIEGTPDPDRVQRILKRIDEMNNG